MFDNDTFIITTTTTTAAAMLTVRIREQYVKSPFDSWYIGGILFMLTVIVVLLYANFYRENTFEILWTRLLTKLQLVQPLSQTMSTSSCPANDRLSI